MTGPPQAVVALTVGHRLVAKLQALGRRDGRRRCRLALPGQDVEYDVGAARTAVERLGAGRLDRLQPVLQHCRQHRDELPVAVVVGRQPGSQPAEGVGQLPVLEGCAVTQCAGLPRQDRHVVPRIVGDLAASEAAGVFGDDLAVLADDDPIGVGPYIHRLPHGTCGDAVLVVVEAHQAGLGHRRFGRMEAVEGAAVVHQGGPLLVLPRAWTRDLEHFPHCLARDRRMRTLLGILNAAIHQPLVDLGIRPAARDGHEQAAAHVTHLLLDLPFLPASARGACHRALRARGRATAPPDGASTSPGSGGCSPASCRQRPWSPPSSCCRRCPAGRPHRRSGRSARGRRAVTRAERTMNTISWPSRGKI